MNILHKLKTMITIIGLEALLLGREVAMSDGASLGMVVAVKMELSQDRIWVVVDNMGRELAIPIEQIASVAREVVLFGNFSMAGSEINGDPCACLTERKMSW